MFFPKQIEVKESLITLKKLKEHTKPFLLPRIQMLIEMVKRQNINLTKKQLADLIDVNPNSIQAWRDLYCKGGISLLLSHNKTGFKSSVFSDAEKIIIEKLINSKKINSYIELHLKVETAIKRTVHYNTLLKYCHRNFKNEISFGRKNLKSSLIPVFKSPYLAKRKMEKKKIKIRK